MEQKGTHPIEEELRASKIYRTLKNAGSPVTEALADGLGRAAQGVDSAIGSAAPGIARGVSQAVDAVRAVVSAPGGGQGAGPAPQGGQQPQKPQPQKPQPPKAPSAPKAPQTPQAPQGAQPPMKLVRKPSSARFYITGAVALALAIRMPMYEWYHFAVFLIVLALIFTGSSILLRGKGEWVPVEPPKAAKKKEEPPKKAPEKEASAPSTGNPEVDKLIREGQEAIKRLRALNDAIPDESLSESIDRMERASADIFRFIAEHPEKAPEIRKFMNYYLPTTLKLLGTYQRLSSQSVRGENINSTLFNIAGMMHTVAIAFEKQLDSLFSDEAMDVSADISVFETLLRQEGFVEDKEGKDKKETGPKG